MFYSDETFLNAKPVLACVVDEGGWPGMTVRQFLEEFENLPLTDDDIEAMDHPLLTPAPHINRF